MKILLSVVSPVYRAQEVLKELVEQVKEQLSSITPHFEIILVDDGSPDSSWEQIQAQARADPRVKGVQLSRNFGQHPAISAGLSIATGEWVIVMDCDLQDRPGEIPSLYTKALTGYDLVLARRIRRQDSWTQCLLSHLFYSFLSLLSGTRYDPTVANFGIYHQRVIPALLQVESLRYFPSMVRWVGFHSSTIDVKHAAREGKSSYTLAKRVRLALDILVSYSDRLLRWMMGLGVLISFLSFCFALLILYRALQGTIPILGYASLMVALSFFAGAILLSLGILGLYMNKIFEGSRPHPSYFINTTVNL